MRCSDDHLPPLPADSSAGFVAEYLGLPLAKRQRIRRRIRAQRRCGLADALVAAPIADRERAALLATCSPGVVAAHLPEIGELVPNLGHLARRHPDELLAELRRRTVGASAAGRNAAWRWVTPGLRRLAQRRPRELAELLAEAGPTSGLPAGVYRQAGGMLRAAPEAMTEALVAAWEPAGPCAMPAMPGARLRRAAARLPQELLFRLLHSRRAHAQVVAAYLSALPPQARAAAFAATYEGITMQARAFDRALLEALPNDLRHAEVTGMRHLPVFRTAPGTLELAGFAAPADAEELVAKHLHGSDLEGRGQAWQALLLAAFRSRDAAVIDHAVQRFAAASAEASPVKQAALEAFALAPTSALTQVSSRHWADLAKSLPETSGTCLGMLATALWRVLGHLARRGHSAPELAELLLGPLGKHSYGILRPIGLSPAAADRWLAPFLGHLHTAPDPVILVLATQLTGRLGRYPDLLDRLETLAANQDSWQLRDALEILVAEPTNRHERLGRMLDRTPSLITHSLIQDAICRYRPDLAHLFYGPDRGPNPIVARGPFNRWQPEHSRPYSLALARYATDRASSTWLQRGAIEALGRLPHLDEQVDRLLCEAENPAIREAGLAALARSHATGWELPELLSLIASPNATAMLSLLSARIAELPPQQAHDLLLLVAQEAPTLGARKLAIRQLARLRFPGTAQVLAEFTHQAALLGAIRATAGVALTEFLETEPAWQALEHLVSDDQATALTRIRPASMARRHRRRFGDLLANAPASVTLAEALGRWLPETSTALTRLAELLVAPEPALRDAAVAALSEGGAGWDWGVILDLIARLAAQADDRSEPNATPDQDLPSLRLLERLVPSLIRVDGHLDVQRRDEISRLADLLGTFPSTQELSWEAQLAATNWMDPGADLARLAAQVTDPMQVGTLRALTRLQLTHVHEAGLEPRLDEAIDLLLASGDGAAGALAVTLLDHAGDTTGWPEDRRERLRRARQHKVPAVARWARQVSAVRH